MKVEGLAQVVVSPCVESLHPVADRIARCKHQNGYSRTAGSQALTDLDSALQGQHHIQKDKVVVVDAGLVKGGLSVERDIDSIGLFAKAFRKKLGCIGLIFDQQYPHESLQLRSLRSKPLTMLAGDT
jgi:hypothetical protein